jgi:hypothetical protein
MGVVKLSGIGYESWMKKSRAEATRHSQVGSAWKITASGGAALWSDATHSAALDESRRRTAFGKRQLEGSLSRSKNSRQ